MDLLQNSPLAAHGIPLDTSEAAFGELRDSSYLKGNGEALRDRMEEDGYLFMRGLLARDDVMAARRHVVEQLKAEDHLEPGTDPMDAILRKDRDNGRFRPDLAEKNQPLQQLLYTGRIMEFYRDFFDEPVRHFDYTWFRALGPGRGTGPHCDIVYMGRGTREKLLTAWVPLGDVSLRLGGLAILEGSNHKQDRIRKYLERDVDTYCSNGRHAKDIEAGVKQWEWGGSLSHNPATLRAKLGGRWLTTTFEAGDFLTFTMYTVHASLDNTSGNRLRFSSDSRYQPSSLPADERWVGENPIGHSMAGKRGRIC
jgi:hypothetical protein